MKKLIAVSSLLALVLAGSGLFAFDILNGDGEKSGFSLDMQARFRANIVTDTDKEHDNDKTWIEEAESDKQAKVSIGVSYDGDNYAFGLGAGWQKKYTGDADVYLDDAWGKYYLLDKQLWIRGGSMDGLWRIDTDPLKKNYGGDNGPGFQINFAPSAVTGLNVGVALPVPKAGARERLDPAGTPSPSPKASGNWGPTYPLMNAAFGLRLNGTIPNLDIGMELDLLGQEDNNGKDKDDVDEKEGNFTGMNFHATAVYTFAPITIKVAGLVEGIADAQTDAYDPRTSIGARLIFDIPNAEGSSLDLGDPWVQFQMLPNAIEISGKKESESFKDMEVAFEWEPSYSIVPDQLKALFWLGVKYKSWAEATSDHKDHALEVAVQPKLEFKFAPNATLGIHDKIWFVRQASFNKDQWAFPDGLKNEIGFRFEWKF